MLSIEYEPKVRVLQALYVHANYVGKPITAKQLSQTAILVDYRKKPRYLRQLLSNYYDQGLVAKQRINGVYGYMLTEKGIRRWRYFKKKIEENPSYLKCIHPKRRLKLISRLK